VRTDARARVKRTCRGMGASSEACRVLDAMVIRESSGDPCAVHRLGPGEYGLGVLGLSCRWHAAKWDGDCEAFRIPEVSAVVAIRIYRRAVQRHGAKDWREVNSVFATGKIQDRAAHDNGFCHRLKRRGIDCSQPLPKLGKKLGTGQTADQEKSLETITSPEI